ncbi:MAG: N-(5'-phosphoribosyl)anthranilate isomerase [Gemmatimonadaceae bacterium]|nr:N-(5'-phosphoribosyl)anthranilate isomerase [Gemmatimonadaceae bacterium]
MTQIKICGLTRAIDAEYADAAGAAYLGVIFAGGPRERSTADARAVLLGRRARKVGVFGAQSATEIAIAATEVGLDVVQLHLDPTAERVQAVRAATGLEVWAVVRTDSGVLDSDAEALAEEADALLLDAKADGALGGSGVQVPWLALGESLDTMARGHRIVLAGGLTPENVAEAIDYVSPTVVDVSSGVERAPGIKDHQRIRAFIDAVRTSGERTE